MPALIIQGNNRFSRYLIHHSDIGQSGIHRSRVRQPATADGRIDRKLDKRHELIEWLLLLRWASIKTASSLIAEKSTSFSNRPDSLRLPVTSFSSWSGPTRHIMASESFGFPMCSAQFHSSELLLAGRDSRCFVPARGLPSGDG